MRTIFRVLWCCVLMACHVGWAVILRVPQDQLTIQEAIDAAQAGDTVQVAPGRYHGEIVLRSGIALQGAGDTTQILDTIKLENAEGVVVSLLQVKGIEPDNHFGIFCLNADAHLHDVTVRNFHHGISMENSRLTLRSSKISESFNAGIQITLNTEATIEENAIFDNIVGIIINETQRAVILRGNHIEENQTGILCHAANLRLRENVIAGNNFVGMQINNSTPDLGTEADPGKNIFINNEQGAIEYTDWKPLTAQMNWWGQATGPLVGQVPGQVRVQPWLRTDPRDVFAVQRSPRYFTIWGRLKWATLKAE